VLSATQDASANAAFQAAPSWQTRAAPPSANDLFGSLVRQNAHNDSKAAPPSPPPPQNNTDAPPPPHTDNNPPANAGNNAAAANNNNSSSQPPASGGSGGTTNDGPSSNAGSNDGASANADNSGAAANGSSQSTTGTTATTASGTSKADNHKSTDGQAAADAATLDTTLLTQQAVNSPTTPLLTPVAVALPPAPPVTNIPSPPNSGGSTAPLAIAAAAIATSSQPLSPTGPSAAGKTDPSQAVPGKTDAGKTDPGTTATTVAINAQTTAKAGVAATPVLAAQGKAQATANGSAAHPTSTDANATGTTTDSTQIAATAQTPATGKLEAANLTAQNPAADAATAMPAAPNHDHAVTAANAAHIAADVADPSAQALGAMQPQLNSASNPISTNNLTATAATNGAVPLSGLAVEITANVKSGKSSFEIRLDPADLGRIDVRVQIDQNGQVTSHLTVEKAETLSMLQQDAPQLQQALNDAGLKTDGGGLQFSLRDQSSSGQNGGNNSNPHAQRLVISDEDAVPAAVAGRSYGRSLGSSGGVDIRV
jgi:flagellar hook-length control protein FliK